MLVAQRSLAPTRISSRKMATPAANKTAAPTIAPPQGFLLLNSLLQPVFVNEIGAEILCYPRTPRAFTDLQDFLTMKMQYALHGWQFSRTPAFASTLKSGKRLYECRAFRVDPLVGEGCEPLVAVLLERVSSGDLSLLHVSKKFNLTAREVEVLRHLLDGLTTKQIATGMDISPNTVKAFLRLIMGKMGATTRSGVVAKALTASL